MSATTPRTDELASHHYSQVHPWNRNEARLKDMTDLARTLETELAAMTARVAELERDAERLTWLEANPIWVSYGHGFRGPGGWAYQDKDKFFHDAPNLRAAIDAARRGET